MNDIQAGCPILDSSKINNSTTASICSNGQITLSVLSNMLPSGGKVEWFYSFDPAFDPAAGQGTSLATVALPVIPVNQCPTRCPDFLSIFINACGPPQDEQYNEFVVLKSGNGFLSTNFQLDFAPQNNIPVSSPYSNSDINVGSSPCGFKKPDDALINVLRQGLCNTTNLFPVTPGDLIPPDALVLFFTSDSVRYNYDLSTLCESGLDLYVMQSNCTRSAGAFTNSSGSDSRATTFSLKNCACTETITYKRNQLSGDDGEFAISGGTILQNVTTPCSAPPYDKFQTWEKITAQVNINDPAFCGKTLYIRPIITPALPACTGNVGDVVSLNVLCNGTFAIVQDDSICSGESVVFNIPGSGSAYSWTVNATANVRGESGGTSSAATFSQTLSLIDNQPGKVTYSFTFTGGSCGSGTQDIEVFVFPDLKPEINGVRVVCSGNATTLSVAGTYKSYLWSTGATSSSISVNTSGTYWVKTVSVAGCEGSDTAVVLLGNAVKPVITGPTVFCTGTSVTLDAGAGFDTYTWNTGDLTQTISVNAPGTYIVNVQAGTCLSADTIVLTNYSSPQVVNSPQNPSCPGAKDGKIQLSLVPATTAAVVEWEDGSSGLIRNGLSGGDYSYTITYGNNCILTGVATLTEAAPIVLTLDVVGAGCAGEPTGSIEVLGANGGTSPYQYAFDGGSYGAIVSWDNLSVRNYLISVADANNCISDTLIAIEQAIPVTVDAGADLSITQGDAITVSPVYTGTDAATIYTWTPETGLNCGSCAMVQAAPLSTTEYLIEVENRFGCKDSDTILIEVTPKKIAWLPSAFSPNGDGKNDIAYILTVIPNTIVKRFLIYNRWGQKMHDVANVPAMNPAFGWNGFYNGERQPVDSYTYFYEVQWEDGSSSTYKGLIFILQ